MRFSVTPAVSSVHSRSMSFLAELRHRQEMIMRNQMAMAPQILTQGQQRLQGVPTQFEPRFMERCVCEFALKSKIIVLWKKDTPENSYRCWREEDMATLRLERKFWCSFLWIKKK